MKLNPSAIILERELVGGNLRKSTLEFSLDHNHILIYNLPLLERIGKVSKLDAWLLVHLVGRMRTIAYPY